MNKPLSLPELQYVQEEQGRHPFLRRRDPDARPAPVAAANIRRWLASLYPGHKFNAVSQKFAGGSSVEVYWPALPGAPRAEDVQTILERFEYAALGSSAPAPVDRDQRLAFQAAFGSAKYVRAHTRDPSLEDLAVFEARAARAQEKQLRAQIAKAPRSSRPRM